MRSARSKARYRFVSDKPGSTFECKLKGKGLDPAVKQYGPCVSPRRYKHLRPGRYVFSVRATDAVGTLGRAAKDKFRLVR